MSTQPKLPRERLSALHAHAASGYLRLLAFVALYVSAAGILIQVHVWLGSPWWLYLVSLPLYLLAAASLHGISLFTHEAVHGVLHPNPWLNRVLGGVCAWPVLQNGSAYRVLHLQHHKHLGVEGDPDHYHNYAERSRIVFLMHWGRLLLGYPAYITAIPILGFYHGRAADRIAIVAELGMAALLFGGLIASGVPFAWWLHAWILPMVLINTMVNIRGMSQHTLLEHESDVVRGTRTILTNPVTQWFMCNENFHLEHHLYPGVPWYHLPELHEELEPELRALGAPFVGSYAEFVQDFVLASFTTRDRRTVTISTLADS